MQDAVRYSLHGINRISSAFMGGDAVGFKQRTGPERQMFFPKSFYHPLWGVGGLTEKPGVAKVALNIPYQRRFNPTNIPADSFHKEHPILNDPNFARKFQARKYNAWQDNYQPIWRTKARDFLPRTELRYQDIGTHEQVGSLTPHTRANYRPIQEGVVSFSSLNTRR